jgi:leucyl-tRNA---protein transferase
MNGTHRVHWLRYSINELKNHSSHKRIRNRNKKFKFRIEDFSMASSEHIELHSRYYSSIDFDGASSINDCLFGTPTHSDNIFNTKCISIFDEEKLIAAGYFDLGAKAAASILHFYDPEFKRYSLGKYLILLTIDFLKSEEYEWYYPGYIVEGLSKMDYKLFLGKTEAQYFDPEILQWKYFQDGLPGIKDH